MRRSAGHANARQRGLSMVELLVGAALGLVVVAASAKVLAAQVGESRRLLLEARLMQDLRTSADLVTRDLRRAGYWGDAATGVWQPGESGVSANPYAALAVADAASDAAFDAIGFTFSRDATENHAIDSNERFGYRLRNGTVEMQLGAGNWQALTDATTLTVTTFSITPTVQRLSLAAWCAKACSGASCPVQEVRRLALQIGGQAQGDASVARRLRSEVRLRNDVVTGHCPV